MAAKLIDGNALSEKILAAVRQRMEETKVVPHLVAVQVGEDPASVFYVKNQKKQCEEMGFKYTLDQLDVKTTQEQLLSEIERLNRDENVTGIILQMPLPEGIDRRVVQQAIDYRKDVEGITPTSLGLLLQDRPQMVPCTALGAVELLHAVVEKIEGLDCTIVGRSEIVGKPIAMLLLSMSRSATVTVCHSKSKDLAAKVASADILFAAVGKPAVIKGEWIKKGAIVIDVGINRIPLKDKDGKPLLNEKGKPKYTTVGDVEFEVAKERAAYITPVPGGVGPMTTAILMRNTLEAALRIKNAL
ncbi:MAG: bifunctional 5,10-methylenetetrahydrofolate dehydrogenase/5,10-methenyltetrahydrofolate cyclohydrolase [Planctomycetota bacterium]|nr:bifunctional 5,10-methylenetetrahydrofolate dehydrogenase/5,10-methenyltetrahydrofolate cyclohydrolase [Planctomycetota bacterium]